MLAIQKKSVLKKRRIILLFLFITIKLVNAQIPIGIKHDVNAVPFNGYFDPIVYSPEKKISKSYNSNSYENGYYYNDKGEKVSGKIKFDNKKIWFKQNTPDSRKKFKPSEVSNFLIGIDSFTVASNFHIKNKLKSKKEYVQYITEFDDLIVVKHYNVKRDITQEITFIDETILIKHKNDSKWDNFFEDNFKKNALKYFGSSSFLKSKINSNKYKKNDFSLIKEAEYNYNFKNNKPIFFDKHWQETSKKEKAKYYAKIVNQKDSIWTLEYFNDSLKLYQIQYSSFFPNVKNGKFKAYYKNGKEREIITFKNNKPKEVKTFNKVGKLDTHYQVTEGKKKKAHIQYQVVNDSTEKNIIKLNGSSSIKVYDSINKLIYTKDYKGQKVASVYRFLGKDTIFQLTDPTYKFKIEKLQNRFSSFILPKKYSEILIDNAQGTVLVSLTINPKGYVINSSILNKVHPQIDKIINDFVTYTLSDKSKFRYRFKPYKKNKVKRYCEVVIPFTFSIDRFYRKSSNYSHFYDWHFHWHMQMHQQMHQQMINSIKLPGN